MIPLYIRIIMYGFPGEVPPGGFPTLGYSSIMKELFRIRNTVTIFPKETASQLVYYHYWSQKTRWAFKKLLLLWNTHRFKNQYGNEEDLYGNSFDDYDENEPILTLWDWRSRRYYRFGHTEIVEHMYAKLVSNHKPTNPYINLPFTREQCIVMKDFLYKSPIDSDTKRELVQKYSELPNNLLFNSQELMRQSGYQTVSERFPTDYMSDTDDIFLDEIIRDLKYVRDDKKVLANEYRKILYQLILIEQTDISFVPQTKCERVLYEKYIRYGLDRTIDWVNNWILLNRRKFYVKHKDRYDFFQTMGVQLGNVRE
jgi:hypothetical protein